MPSTNFLKKECLFSEKSGGGVGQGVSSSRAVFIGATKRGPLNEPIKISNFSEYQKTFGNDTSLSETTDQVRQYFFNGGKTALVTRIAQNAQRSEIVLRNTDQKDVLKVTAKDKGSDGNLIRIEVDYNTPHPDATFNLKVLRMSNQKNAANLPESCEFFTQLTMNPRSNKFVEKVINQRSRLIRVNLCSLVPSPIQGFSQSGILFDPKTSDKSLQIAFNYLLSYGNQLRISTDGSPFVTVTLEELGVPFNFSKWQKAINSALAPFGVSKVTVSFVSFAGHRCLRITSSKKEGGQVNIKKTLFCDASMAFELGVENGGIELGGFANRRPAPTGIFARLGTPHFKNLSAFTQSKKHHIGPWQLRDGREPTVSIPKFEGSGQHFYEKNELLGVVKGSLRYVREHLSTLGSSIVQTTDGAFRASLQGLRLVLVPTTGDYDPEFFRLQSLGIYDIGNSSDGLFPDSQDDRSANLRQYHLGSTERSVFQTQEQQGYDGDPPDVPDYNGAFHTLEGRTSNYDMMILPRTYGTDEDPREAVWGLASIFCQKHKAILLVDPPLWWIDAVIAQQGIEQLRYGMVKDHSVIHWPRLIVAGEKGRYRSIDPSGSVAGLISRIDHQRGPWESPSGSSADLRGVCDVDFELSEIESKILKAEGINSIRNLPKGVINQSARTMDGFDYSECPTFQELSVRRLALYIEKTLARDLQLVCSKFKNGSLLTQVRLSTHTFLHKLFLLGVFKGTRPFEAYSVKVDRSTTSDKDLRRGSINVIVGFAPSEPRQFVVIPIPIRIDRKDSVPNEC